MTTEANQQLLRSRFAERIGVGGMVEMRQVVDGTANRAGAIEILELKGECQS